MIRREVERDPKLRAGILLAHPRDREAVCEQQVMAGRDGGPRVGGAWRVLAGRVAGERRVERLVERRPVTHPIAQPLVHRGRVVGEAQRGVARRPAAAVLERLREIPVIERDPWLDRLPFELVEQALVEVEPGLVDRAAARRHQPRPREREPVDAGTELSEQGHVVAEAVVVIACDASRVAVEDRPRTGAERVPDRRSPAALLNGTLDLVGRGRRSPREPWRKARHRRAPGSQ